ncbi:hypothetical protein DKL61_00040 [Gammaproteobacteria bacterium ESL0073]|nr:hypothetical protein DKL61_00040 [Gammaproteobacteria bacterium ESL0073]
MSLKNAAELNSTAQRINSSLKNTSSTRVREPITRSRGKVRGQFPSTKMGRLIAWESQLERRACYLFEFCKAVEAFREQPIRLYIPFNEVIKRYTPDFELILQTGEIWYIEIKPANKLLDLSLLAFYQAASKELVNKGYTFVIITDQELNHPIRERNLVRLRHYQDSSLSRELINQTTYWLSQKADCNLAELAHYTGSYQQAYSLLAQGHLSFNLEQPLTEHTLIYIKENTNENSLFTGRTSPDFRPRTLHHR